MKIDFVSDVICPWCYIGLARLDQALDLAGIDRAVVAFHPFQLDPTTPPEGADLRERLRTKYGADPEKMFERVVAAARESGIDLDFSKVRRTPNTLKAHVLIGAAAARGTQRDVARALFAAYFREGLDVGDDDVLVGVATRNGFGAEEAAAILGDAELRSATQALARSFAQQGIGGVPFIVFDERVAVSGAQPPAVFAEAIRRAKAA